MVHLALVAELHAGDAGTAAAVVGEVEAGFLGGFEDVFVFSALDGYAALLEGYVVGLAP